MHAAFAVLISRAHPIKSQLVSLEFFCKQHHALYASLQLSPASCSAACTSERDYKDAAAVAKAIGIELVRVDFVKQYWNSVFTTFIKQYAAGLTPNPDILCNRFVKFGYLWEHAQALGADRLATGHYAAVDGHATGGGVRLMRPRDEVKDQTYFLCQVCVRALQLCTIVLCLCV